MANFKHYRIYCETEAAWVPTWADTPPVVCPNNPAHTVRSESAAQFQTKLIVVVPDADGQGVLGGEAGVGDEMEAVLGAAHIHKSSADAVAGLVLQCATGHPTGYGCLQLDMDVDGPGLIIDSEATSFPLLQLDGLNGNSRGDLAFGASRVADPGAPSEGDIWYDGGVHYFRYRDDAAIQTLAPSSEVFWTSDGSGHIYAKTDTDDLYIGGATPNGVWFDDGDLVLGGSAMVGSEKLLVVGGELIDQNANAAGLDIDSEATSAPLVNLQPINGNSRGDIAFGTARTADPSAPAQGDFWYESTLGELKFRKASSTVKVRNAIEIQGTPVNAGAPSNGQLLAYGIGGAYWEPVNSNALAGPYHAVATATASTSTTSGTYALMSGMTFTPPAGTYLVSFNTVLQESNNGEMIYVAIYVGGAIVTASQRMIQQSRWNNSSIPIATSAVVTVNGSQAIEVRWYRSGGTATALERVLSAVRVS